GAPVLAVQRAARARPLRAGRATQGRFARWFHRHARRGARTQRRRHRPAAQPVPHGGGAATASARRRPLPPPTVVHVRGAAPARRSLLFGAGIGITPLLSMAEALHARGAAFELHYSARSSDQAAFRAQLAAAPYADRVRFHFSAGPGANRLELPPLLSTPDPE